MNGEAEAAGAVGYGSRLQQAFIGFVKNTTMGTGLRRALRSAHITVPPHQYLKQTVYASIT
ncbi:MAG: hypothetical protein ACXQTN_05065, partial [Methanoculleaceae archaeon]